MDHEHGHGNENDDEASCPMIMTFHAGFCEAILLQSWTVNTFESFLIVLAVVFIVAVGYEGLKYFREKLFYMSMSSESDKLKSAENGIVTNQRNNNSNNNNTTTKQKMPNNYILNKAHLLQTLLHFIHAIISYCLMLIVMTYNIWLFAAVVVGATFGHFCFGFLRQKLFFSMSISDHCN